MCRARARAGPTRRAPRFSQFPQGRPSLFWPILADGDSWSAWPFHPAKTAKSLRGSRIEGRAQESTNHTKGFPFTLLICERAFGHRVLLVSALQAEFRKAVIVETLRG